VLYVLRFRLADLGSGDPLAGDRDVRRAPPRRRGEREDNPWWYSYSDNRDVMQRIHQLGERFEPVPMIAERSL
jgi:hypothetical protein